MSDPEESWCDKVLREEKRDHFWSWLWNYKVQGIWLEFLWRLDWIRDLPDWEGNGIRTGKRKEKQP